MPKRTGKGAIGLNCDFRDVEAELAWMRTLQRAAGRTVWFLLAQFNDDPDKYRRILIALFTRYSENSLLLPESQRRRLSEEGTARLIADYIAGMTDRYALDEYRRLFDPDTKV